MPRASSSSFSLIHSSILTYSFKTPRLGPNLHPFYIYARGFHLRKILSSRNTKNKAAFHINSASIVSPANTSKFQSNKNNRNIQGLSTWPYLHRSKDPTMAPQLDGFFKQVDSLSESFIDRLRRAVAIPSVSADDERRGDVVKVRSFGSLYMARNSAHRVLSWGI